MRALFKGRKENCGNWIPIKTGSLQIALELLGEEKAAIANDSIKRHAYRHNAKHD